MQHLSPPACYLRRRAELHNLLQEERLFGATLLIFANKQDIASALSVPELEKVCVVRPHVAAGPDTSRDATAQVAGVQLSPAAHGRRRL